MSIQILSVAPPLVSLFFFAFVVAGVNVTVTANCTLPSLAWAFNSIGQSPCVVAAYMLATCHGGSCTLTPPSEGNTYHGTTREHPNNCECSTVGYSLMSACAACQGKRTIYWSGYVTNCTSTLPPSQFPNPVPEGIYVPHWAILDVTKENYWNDNASYAAGDKPEYGPGAFFGPSGVSTSSASASSTASSTPSHSKSHAGPIAGGVVGGVAMISVAVAAIFYLRWRRSQAASAGVSASQPMPDNGTVAQSSSESPLTMKFYDPDDPTTYPGYQGGPGFLDIPSTSQVPSHVESGNMLADMQTSVPNPRGYHGLPMPSA